MPTLNSRRKLLVLQLQTHEKLPSLLDASMNDGSVNSLDHAVTTPRRIVKADGVPTTVKV